MVQPLAQPDDAAEAVEHAKALAGGRATSRRQLLVPRSSAAKVGAPAGGKGRLGVLIQRLRGELDHRLGFRSLYDILVTRRVAGKPHFLVCCRATGPRAIRPAPFAAWGIV